MINYINFRARILIRCISLQAKQVDLAPRSFAAARRSLASGSTCGKSTSGATKDSSSLNLAGNIRNCLKRYS